MLLEVEHPFIGLRSYDASEVDIFFGREQQVDQLLERLNTQHFLAVVGPSGCGKSSLVRAGLIGALRSGLLAKHGPMWRVAELRPGNSPFRRLAEAIQKADFFSETYSDSETQLAFFESKLRTGPKSIAELCEESGINKNANLLILVDQFEEIFRFRKEQNIDEAEAFVSLLLETTAKLNRPIFVVLTMRTDYLGTCSLFNGLPERLNGSQFLTPRLTREQCREAIEKPILLGGGTIDEALTNQLLNDFGSDPDQLPLLQHTLMRMWNKKKMGDKSLDAETYQQVGSISRCLSLHADEIFAILLLPEQAVAEGVFKCLTDSVTHDSAVRRPLKVEELAAITGYPKELIISVIEPFRSEGRNFISPPNEILSGLTTVDITHESIMRQWDLLRAWMLEEQSKARIYKWLAEAVENKRALLKGIDLTTAKEFAKDVNENWAELYVPSKRRRISLKMVLDYISDSSHKSFVNRALYAVPAIFLFVLGVLILNLSNTSQNYEVLYDKEYGAALDQIRQKYGPIAEYTSLRAFRTSVAESTMGYRTTLLETIGDRLESIVKGDSLYGYFPLSDDRRIFPSAQSDRYFLSVELNDRVLQIRDLVTNKVVTKPLPEMNYRNFSTPIVVCSDENETLYFTWYKDEGYNQTCFFGSIDEDPFHEYPVENGIDIKDVSVTKDHSYRLFLRQRPYFAPDRNYLEQLSSIRFEVSTGLFTKEDFPYRVPVNTIGRVIPAMARDSSWYILDQRTKVAKSIKDLSANSRITRVIVHAADTILVDRDSILIFRSRIAKGMKSKVISDVSELTDLKLKDSLLIMRYKGKYSTQGIQTRGGLLVLDIVNGALKGFPVNINAGFLIDAVRPGFVMIVDKATRAKCLVVLKKDLRSIPKEFEYSEVDLKKMRIQN